MAMCSLNGRKPTQWLRYTSPSQMNGLHDQQNEEVSLVPSDRTKLRMITEKKTPAVVLLLSHLQSAAVKTAMRAADSMASYSGPKLSICKDSGSICA